MGNAENLSAPAMLMAVGGLVFLAHIFQFAFQRFRVPDTLWLIGIGLVAGPVTHWLQPKDFGHRGPRAHRYRAGGHSFRGRPRPSIPGQLAIDPLPRIRLFGGV
jgi:hypothetical protein